MRLRELVAFVQRLDVVSGRGFTDQRLVRVIDEPNVPRLERLPAPWLDGASVARVRDRDFPVWIDELPTSPILPPDVRQPNPPIDALAYYRPFHFDPTEWGVYIRESGLLVVGSICAGTSPSSLDSTVLATARAVLMAHELHHFQTEVACSRAEVVAKLRAYDVYFRDSIAAAHEEGVANAAAVRSLRWEPEAVQGRVRAWMERQGAGYREFDRWLTPPKFAAGLRRSSNQILNHLPRPAGASEPAEFLFDAVNRFGVPTFLVRDLTAGIDLKPFPAAHGIRVLVHTRDHPPPHVHVQRPPGVDFSRYEWPALAPLKGDPPLTSAARKALNEYLSEYGDEIDAKVRAVYPAVAPWTPPSRPAA
jgi:hypothetical protein